MRLELFFSGLSLEYLRRAMRMRMAPPVVKKQNLVGIPAYENRYYNFLVAELLFDSKYSLLFAVSVIL